MFFISCGCRAIYAGKLKKNKERKKSGPRFNCKGSKTAKESECMASIFRAFIKTLVGTVVSWHLGW